MQTQAFTPGHHPRRCTPAAARPFGCRQQGRCCAVVAAAGPAAAATTPPSLPPLDGGSAAAAAAAMAASTAWLSSESSGSSEPKPDSAGSAAAAPAPPGPPAGPAARLAPWCRPVASAMRRASTCTEGAQGGEGAPQSVLARSAFLSSSDIPPARPPALLAAAQPEAGACRKSGLPKVLGMAWHSLSVHPPPSPCRAARPAGAAGAPSPAPAPG